MIFLLTFILVTSFIIAVASSFFCLVALFDGNSALFPLIVIAAIAWGVYAGARAQTNVMNTPNSIEQKK